MTDQPRRAAFFDVDETVISVKSMFRFLEFFLREQGRPGSEYQIIATELRELAASGVPREETNRLYYRSYQNHRVREVEECGARWFQTELAEGGLFRPEVVAELQQHRRDGVRTVLVSGSFPPCIDPIARYLGASQIECTRPAIMAGSYTGEVATPLIGQAKADAVGRVMTAVGAAAADCVAYGDHISDLPMLSMVGEPVMVGADPALATHAAAHGWRRIAAEPALS